MSYRKRPEEIEAENARTLHFMLTPMRMLYQIMVALGLVGMIIGLLFINVDLGPRSERARQEVVANLSGSVGGDFNTDQKMIDITASFIDRAGGTYSYEGDSPESWKWKDHFWVTNRTGYMDDAYYFIGEGDKEHYRTLSPFILTAHRERMPLLGFPFCHVGNPGIFDTKLASWSEREDPEYVLAKNADSGHEWRADSQGFY